VDRSRSGIPKKSGWEKTHIFGIRSDVWNPDEIEHRRLVIKMFKSTGERIRWAGTIEEITTREVHNSIGSRRAVLSLAALLPGHEYLVMVQQNHRTFRIPSIFTFRLLRRGSRSDAVRRHQAQMGFVRRRLRD